MQSAQILLEGKSKSESLALAEMLLTFSSPCEVEAFDVASLDKDTDADLMGRPQEIR